jgi:putative glutamine amidotransferase
MTSISHRRPLIGLTPSLDLGEPPADGGPRPLRIRVNATYLECLERAGGLPVVLAPDPRLIPEYLDRLDGVILTGGPDIDPRGAGIPLHERAEIMDPRRQAFDFALLESLAARPSLPVLGICLGMQEMGVHGGCPLVQHLPDVVPTGHQHVDDQIHEIAGPFGRGPVTSAHHQALGAPGPFEVLAVSHDGVIETIRDPRRPFYLGVQWHPERTADPALGDGVVRMLVAAAGG